jgi:hypothetical protein
MKYVVVRAEDLQAALTGCASAYGSSAKNEKGEYILDWFGRLAERLEGPGMCNGCIGGEDCHMAERCVFPTIRPQEDRWKPPTL